MSKAVNMTSGNPIKLIVEFAIPMLIGNIFQQIYNVADAVIVGKFIGSEALAAVGSTGTTIFLLICWIVGLANGAGIIISQYFGANNYSEMRKSVVALLYIVGVMTVIISSLGFFCARPMLELLNTPEDIIVNAQSYLKITIVGVWGMSIYNVCASVLRGIGDSKTPLYALIVACIINVGLDILFVVKLNMGINGTAYATIIAQVISAIILIVFILKTQSILHIQKHEWKFNKFMIKKILHMGIPNALQSSLISLGGISVQRLVNSFGTVTVAAYTASNKIDSMAIQPVVSIGMAMSIFTAQNMGAVQVDRVKKGLKQTLIMMIIVCVIIASAILIFRNQLLTLFLDSTKDFEAIKIGAKYLSIIGIAYVIAGVMQSFLNVLKGSGDINVSMSIGLIELASRVVFAYLLANIFGVVGIWIATPLSWGTACSITIIRYFSGKWKNKVVV